MDSLRILQAVGGRAAPAVGDTDGRCGGVSTAPSQGAQRLAGMGQRQAAREARADGETT